MVPNTSPKTVAKLTESMLFTPVRNSTHKFIRLLLGFLPELKVTLCGQVIHLSKDALRNKGSMLAAFSHHSKDQGEAKRCSFSERVRQHTNKEKDKRGEQD